MTTWHLLAQFWLHHDLFFATHFPRFEGWADWNLHHFRHVHHIRQFDAWDALWEWVNIHG